MAASTTPTQTTAKSLAGSLERIFKAETQRALMASEAPLEPSKPTRIPFRSSSNDYFLVSDKADAGKQYVLIHGTGRGGSDVWVTASTVRRLSNALR
jgi:hypothetical protein